MDEFLEMYCLIHGIVYKKEKTSKDFEIHEELSINVINNKMMVLVEKNQELVRGARVWGDHFINNKHKVIIFKEDNNGNYIPSSIINSIDPLLLYSRYESKGKIFRKIKSVIPSQIDKEDVKHEAIISSEIMKGTYVIDNEDVEFVKRKANESIILNVNDLIGLILIKIKENMSKLFFIR